MVSNNNFVFSREINLKDIENYLNSISSLNSEIVQTDQNGNEIFGSLKLKKPGKLRIEYFNNKSDHLIVGSNGIIAIIDYNSKFYCSGSKELGASTFHCWAWHCPQTLQAIHW